MKKVLAFITALNIGLLYMTNTAHTQQYKLRQVTSMMNMKMESTIYVKGMRKRTESGGMMGMGANMVTIEQCDLKRIVQLNDKKKLYMIQPFSQMGAVVKEEKPSPTEPKNVAKRKGGVITMWYNIMDTGERKKMYGFTARHIWTSQKIKPSADACAMKDSMLMKTDGWYIDLPEFNCPVDYRHAQGFNDGNAPDCIDRYVTHSSGKGKLGFPLQLTTTMIMGNQPEVTTSIETIEFSTAKLDSTLFVIPPGYRQARNWEEMQDPVNMNDVMKGVINNDEIANKVVGEEKKSGIIRIGVFVPTGNTEVQAGQLQRQMVNTLRDDNVEAIAVSTLEEARKYNCDYTLNTAFTNVKPETKVGGILKAIKNADPTAATAYNIQADLTLNRVMDDSVKSLQTVAGKYEGKLDNAARQALEEGCLRLLKSLR